MNRVQFCLLAHSALILAVTQACESASRAQPDAGDPVVGSLIQPREDYTQIGVVDGTPEYQFFRISGVVRLSTGNLVVANTGTSELRYYGRNGAYLFRAGGYGSGPGEFRSLQGVYEITPDTVLAFDRIGRKSYYDGDGAFIESENIQLSENRFPMDIWLYRRNWVEGVPDDADRRAGAARALDRLPHPTTAPYYNYVRVDAANNLWVSAGQNANGSRDMWTVFTPDGLPITRVRLDDRFTLSSIETDELLGVWRDEDDIEFIRTYPFTLPRAELTNRDSALLSSGAASSDTVSLDVVAQESRAVLRMMVTAQELYFGDHRTYTKDVTRLDIELPESLSIDLLSVAGTGWLAVLVHDHAPGICGIGLGSQTPAGWMEGVPTCAQLTANDP